MNLRRFLPAVLPALLLLAPSAQAAESYASCKGYIDSLPATITTQGVWCLRADLSTAMASGSVVTIGANNVTLDCNDHRIDGRAAGLGSDAIGIQVNAGRLNVSIKRCDVRGFRVGVRLEGAGNTIESSRISGASLTGVQAIGDGHIVRGNQISHLRGRDEHVAVTGVHASGAGVRVIDNDINDLAAYSTYPGAPSIGIQIEHGTAEGNRLSGIHGYPGLSNPIVLVQAVAADNRIMNGMIEGSSSIQGDNDTRTVCRGNVIWGLVLPPANCQASDNVVSVPPLE